MGRWELPGKAGPVPPSLLSLVPTFSPDEFFLLCWKLELTKTSSMPSLNQLAFKAACSDALGFLGMHSHSGAMFMALRPPTLMDRLVVFQNPWMWSQESGPRAWLHPHRRSPPL